jgi:methylmalonyl-CoA/ethylmalonyl-CoA epimerase
MPAEIAATVMLQFHHVGVGTARFDEAIETYQQLGHRLLVRVDDPLLNIRVAFLAGTAHPLIEILAPLNQPGPLDSYVRRKLLPSPYHTCYEVADMDDGVNRLREMGFRQVSEPLPAVALQGARVAFFHQPSIGLLELAERPPKLTGA